MKDLKQAVERLRELREKYPQGKHFPLDEIHKAEDEQRVLVYQIADAVLSGQFIHRDEIEYLAMQCREDQQNGKFSTFGREGSGMAFDHCAKQLENLLNQDE